MTDLRKYPATGYNSYLNDLDGEEYFMARLHCESWDAAAPAYREAALMQSFRTLKELDLNISFDADGLLNATAYSTAQAAAILATLKEAQAEQALWELTNDVDNPTMVNRVSIGGVLSMGFGNQEKAPSRYSPRTLEILRPYLRAKTVSRYR